MRERKSSF